MLTQNFKNAPYNYNAIDPRIKHEVYIAIIDTQKRKKVSDQLTIKKSHWRFASFIISPPSLLPFRSAFFCLSNTVDVAKIYILKFQFNWEKLTSKISIYGWCLFWMKYIMKLCDFGMNCMGNQQMRVLKCFVVVQLVPCYGHDLGHV